LGVGVFVTHVIALRFFGRLLYLLSKVCFHFGSPFEVSVKAFYLGGNVEQFTYINANQVQKSILNKLHDHFFPAFFFICFQNCIMHI
jgi:hypothetical protein